MPISDEIYFISKSVKRRSLHNDININLPRGNNSKYVYIKVRISKYIKQTLIALKGEIESNALIAEGT
jgi:hypothetical protein